MSKPALPPIRKWNARDPIGAVHIIHGLAEHPERYNELATELNVAGFIVWAHHQRGHGDNPRPGVQGHFGDHDGWRLLIDDAWAVSNQLKSETGLPLVMFAHSMGSFVGQGVLAEHGSAYRSAIFSGTNGRRERLTDGWRREQTVVEVAPQRAFPIDHRPNCG